MLEFNAGKHEYTWDGKKVPCVSNIIAPLYDFSNIPPQVLETKKEWGTAVHLYLEMNDRGTLDPDKSKWDDRMIPIVDAWNRFKSQYNLGGECEIEAPKYNELMRYAGTPDRIYTVQATIVDIKTSAPNKTAGVQLAAYNKLILAENTPIYRLIACFLTDDGSYKVKEYNFKENWNIFMCCYSIYQFKHGGK